MKYGLLWLIFLLLALILQSTLLPLIAYRGVHGDLLLMIVVLSSLHLGKKHGVMIGFAAGLLQDLFSGTIFGLYTFTNLFIAYVFGSAERKVFKENMVLPIIAAAVATIISYLVGACILFMVGYPINLLENISLVMMPLLVYNVILSLPVHRLIRKISGKAKEIMH